MAKKKTETSERTPVDAQESSGAEEGYYSSHEGCMADSKRAVAKKVVDPKEGLIRDDDSVVLDAGSSSTFVAEAIFSSSFRNLSVLTHNMDVFRKFGSGPKGKHQLLLTGGHYDSSYNALYGPLTEKAYGQFHPRVVVLAISGLTASSNPRIPSGVYCHAAIETDVKELLFALPAERRIIIADHSKIGKVDTHMFGDLSEIQSRLVSKLSEVYLVTTQPPETASQETVKVFEETRKVLALLGINVVLAGVSAREGQASGRRSRASAGRLISL